ncbi:glycoside hydrolase family 97 protein [Marinifilum caeruleilacunae]|uniref:Glycoside hydrolase family 97 protein n=1 Tax=Marinifilum caeruleilacunae TaxID=2499076 RepID=A0ABX1WU98_9BACT|nr:glycoside hydrolase family 97 protein [Marinifilum caeruleilacunae]NOU59679.1 glycoside hydrolase family 97 protein [Marinifilum caeruleilacunae]
MTRNIICLLILICFAGAIHAKEYELQSPDKKTNILIRTGEEISFELSYNKIPLLLPTKIAMVLEDLTLGENPKVINKTIQSVNRTITPEVCEKTNRIEENYNELKLSFQKGFDLCFRAYNNGIAYRFESRFAKEITVKSEKGDFQFANNHLLYWPKEKSFHSNNQVYYDFTSIGQLTSADLGSLPVLMDSGKGVKMVIGETDLEDYPGMWFNGAEGNALTATFPAYPNKTEQVGDRDVFVRDRMDYIAKTQGTRTFPWRYIAIAENDGELITNQLSWLLAAPCEIENPSWIRPGKVAWDWWNANNVYGVDFRAGINTETYKYYIDFAAEYGLEYIILDEGWYELGDLMKIVPEMDMEELTTYAKEKGVGLILWVVWKTLDDQLEEALDQFQKWDIKGIKVDFMDKDDQWMVNYYHKVARESAKRQILVDFHGSYKPAGLRRKYPNVLTREGVNGGEQYKWSLRQTPEHNLITPFSRMVAGPMDYTPGAMNNAQKKNYKPIFDRPMSMGTRCHQLAMYVAYESPLQMLCDNPSNYRKEEECMKFLSAVPAVWDETRVLDAKIADYLLLARRKGEDWYLGAMTDWDARTLQIDLSFLPKGKKYKMTLYQDGVNADRNAIDYKMKEIIVDRNYQAECKLAPGGGMAAMLQPL